MKGFEQATTPMQLQSQQDANVDGAATQGWAKAAGNAAAKDYLSGQNRALLEQGGLSDPTKWPSVEATTILNIDLNRMLNAARAEGADESASLIYEMLMALKAIVLPNGFDTSYENLERARRLIEIATAP